MINSRMISFNRHWFPFLGQKTDYGLFVMDYFEVFDYGLFDTKFMIDKNRGAEIILVTFHWKIS